MVTLNRPIDRSSDDWKKVAKYLQGNILQGFPSDHSTILIITLDAPYDESDVRTFSGKARSVLSRFANTFLTTAEKQDAVYASIKPQKAQANAAGGIPEQPQKDYVYCNVFLSAEGYLGLGFGSDELVRLFPHPQADPAFDNWFLAGMKHKGEWLGDPPKYAWERKLQMRMDIVVLLSHDSPDLLATRTAEAKAALAPIARRISLEEGKRSRAQSGAAEGRIIDHFGFVDGISQPQFFANSDPREIEDPNSVLVPDRCAASMSPQEGGAAFGSYLVFRKLEQDVKGFREEELRLSEVIAEQLDGPGSAPTEALKERVGAMVVGRFRDGTPLTKYDSPRGVTDNDFNYDADEAGRQCPFHAHVRKARPRLIGRERMVRRGYSYGVVDHAETSIENLPEAGVGLLFLSFQRNIHSQFGAVQKHWLSSSSFPQDRVGADPLAGQGNSREEQQWPLAWGKEATVGFRFDRFVRLQGGEFFFAPSSLFFEQLAD